MAGSKREMTRLIWVDGPARRAARVTCISDATRAELLAIVPGLDPDKVRVVYDPIPDDYTPVPLAPVGRVPRLLQIGTGRHNKNLNGVARAIAGLDCDLDVVGPLAPDQRELLSSLGVSYRNLVNITEEALRAVIAEADVVVFASKYEGFGLPIIEAQAIGRPVVTSTLCSMPEVAGGAAMLVDPYSIREIREAILTLLENEPLRRELVQKGLENVKRFDRRLIARQYVEIYRELWEGP
jgi:glycosyltransferase involved in cell wall biosynthesis